MLDEGNHFVHVQVDDPLARAVGVSIEANGEG